MWYQRWMEKQVYDRSWRGSTNKPTLRAALLGVVSSPQYRSRESRQPHKNPLASAFLYHVVRDPASDHWGYWEHSRSQQLSRGGLERSNSPSRHSSRSHLKMLTLKHSEITVRESGREMVLGVVEPSPN